MSPRPPRSRLVSIKKHGHLSKRQARRQVPKPVQCPECASSNVEDYNGSTVCADCGTTISESNIVSEVTFGETAAGAAVVQGAYIGADQRNAKSSAGRFGRSYGAREPREVSEMNGKEELRRQANWHRLHDHVFDQAFSIYKLALNHNFIQGRQISVVAAVCLYAACRRNKECQMLLIDFSEGIAVNVFRLGQTWSDLKKTLFLEDLHHRPVMEVEDLITRFTRKLEFGKDGKKIAGDALLILRRMKRDWMVTGRLPGGLIGACIILAARMNNYRRTVREVVYVVKVGDITISKRLEEFKRTPAATMSVEQFREMGLRLKQGTPPVVYETREREKKRKLIAMQDDENPSSASDNQLLIAGSVSGDAVHEPTLGELIQRRELRRDADGFAIPNPPIDPRLRGPNSSTPEARIASPTQTALSTTEPAVPAKRPRGRPPGKTPRGPPVQFTQEDLISENQLEEEMETILNDTQAFMTADPETIMVNEAVEARSRALAENLRNGAEIPRGNVSDDPVISANEFEDDPEVANCLLSESETKMKERIWVTHNEDWLRAQQAKMLKKALADSQAIEVQKQPEKKKRGKRRRIGDGSLLEGTSVSNAADATRLMLNKHAHGPSKHINYSTIDALYKEFRGTDSSDANSSRATSMALSESNPPEHVVSVAANNTDVAGNPPSPQEAETASPALRAGLPTPAATQVTVDLVEPAQIVDEENAGQQSEHGQKESVTAQGAEEDAMEEEDEYDDYEDDEPDPWNSDEDEDEVDVARTARKAGIDMGDMDEDETAGWSDHEEDD